MIEKMKKMTKTKMKGLKRTRTKKKKKTKTKKKRRKTKTRMEEEEDENEDGSAVNDDAYDPRDFALFALQYKFTYALPCMEELQLLNARLDGEKIYGNMDGRMNG